MTAATSNEHDDRPKGGTHRPRKVSSSPIAGEDRTSSFALRLLVGSIVLFVVAAIVIAIAFLVVDIDHQRTLAAENTNAKVLNSLQTGNSGAVRASISKVGENSKMDYAFTFSPTETMLILNVTITNVTASTQHLLPVNQLYVRTDEGDYAPLHASMYVTKQLSATDLAPGQTVSGQVSFAVPTRASRPLLYIDTGWGNYTPLVFDVLH